MTLNPAWFLNATGQFTPLGGIPSTSAGSFLSIVTHAATANVAIPSTSAFTDFGPGVNLGSTGTWLVIAPTQLIGSGVSAASAAVKLWDGTTLLSEAVETLAQSADAFITLVGTITNPAGNLKVSGQAFNAGAQLTMVSTNELAVPCSYITGIRIG